MRKLLLLLAVVGMVFTACEPVNELDENNNGNNTEQPGSGNQGGEDIPADAYIGLNKDAITFAPDGGSIDVTVYSNYKWTLSTSCDWCIASMSEGEASEVGTVVTLSADVAYDDRETTFIFSCGNAKKVLIVSQKLKETIIADENNTFNVPAEGGVVEIAYQTTVECEVVIPQSAQSWISLTPQTRTLISEKAILTIAENTTYSGRETVVKVVKVGDNTLFAEYTISQVQNDAIIAENNTLNIGGWQQNVTIQYQTNVECEVVISDDCKEWVSVVPATRALSKNSVTLDFADNNTGIERKGVVQVVAVNNKELVAEYSVTQNQRYIIEYTTNDGNAVQYNKLSGVGNHRYENGVGHIDFTESITSIGSYAFYGCSSLTSITIPDSVTEIGHKAFMECSSLTAFYGKYASVDNRFLIIDGVLNSFAPAGLTEYIIPDSVTSIGDYAFCYCRSLTSVTIPESVTSIESMAFGHCISLTSVTIPESITSIGDNAFYNALSNRAGELIINSKIIETDYTSSNYPAKNGWLRGAKFTKLTIGDNITKIGNYTFFGCSSLTSVTIPESIISIGDDAFYDCAGELIINSKIVETDYTSSNYPAKNGWLRGAKFTKLTIGNRITKIGSRAFDDCSSLTSVTIPNSVTSIGEYAFSSCDALTSITIPDSVTSIGTSAFNGCSSLTSLIIPNSITSIGNYAFRSCDSLTSINIPNSVTKIGEGAFRYCSSLTSVTIPDSVTSIEYAAFSDCISLKSVYISDLLAWCKIDFGNSNANPLCNGAKLYLNGSELTDITIPSDITEIKRAAFRSCSSLTSVTIPDSVTEIGVDAFHNCTSLTNVIIGNGVTSILTNSFRVCTSLTSVTIGNGVTSIGAGAFYDCTSLKEVYCKVTTPPAIHHSTSLSVFPFNSGMKIYVPRHSYDAYMQYSDSSNSIAQTNWSCYKDFIQPYDFE